MILSVLLFVIIWSSSWNLSSKLLEEPQRYDQAVLVEGRENPMASSEDGTTMEEELTVALQLL